MYNIGKKVIVLEKSVTYKIQVFSQRDYISLEYEYEIEVLYKNEKGGLVLLLVKSLRTFG